MDNRKEAPVMRRGVIAVLVLIAGFVFVSAVYASFPEDKSRPGKLRTADMSCLKKFQRETLSLRDELITKRLELSREFSKQRPDREHISALQKRITDIRKRIKKKADDAGISGSCSGGTGCGWISKKGII